MNHAIAILIPIYITYIILIGLMMFTKRLRAIKDKKISLQYFKDYQEQAPYELQVYKNHYENQFQIPILFMILCTAVILSKTITISTVILCYSFVLTRFAHTYFHLGKNNLRSRGITYIIGAFVVLALWIQFFLNITT